MDLQTASHVLDVVLGEAWLNIIGDDVALTVFALGDLVCCVGTTSGGTVEGVSTVNIVSLLSRGALVLRVTSFRETE